MNKDIINPSKKTITYAATLSSVVSLLPVEEPDVPYLNRSNGIVSITTTPRKGQWAYGKNPPSIPSVRPNPHKRGVPDG